MHSLDLDSLGIDQIAIDSRRIRSKRALFVALPGANTDGHRYVADAAAAGACAALVRHGFECPGIRLIHVDDPLRALQELAARHRRRLTTTIVAITGSYGKTMLKDALSHLLGPYKRTFASPESFNSQLGVALSLLAIEPAHEVALIEAGISHPGEMERHAATICPDHVIITAFGDAHIASMGSHEVIEHEKRLLLRNVPPGSRCLTPPHEGHPHFDLIRLATQAAALLGLTQSQIDTALATYAPEPMRIEIWRSQRGVTLINDTYCDDPMSLDVALQQLPPTGKRTVCFDGFRTPHDQVDKHRAASSIASAGCTTAHDVVAAHAAAQPGDTILIKGARKQPIDALIRAIDGSPPNNFAVINLAAIQANIERLRAHLPPSMRLMVMVKALAYGTDDVRVAQFLQRCGIDILGVSYVDEAIALRQAGITTALFVLNATPDEAAKVAAYNLEVGVSDEKLIDALAGHRVKLHLHVDTGMSRFGCKPEQAAALARRIRECPHMTLEGIFTHLAAADDPMHDAFTDQQIAQLDAAAAAVGPVPWLHACNSSAAIRFGREAYGTMARVGIAAYGLHTSSATQSCLQLQPAISLLSRIVGINECPPGTTVSYGRTHALRHHARLAVLPIGYYDGLHRSYSGKGHVRIRGQLAPMVGTICMDYMMVDVTAIPDATIGDTALLFGEDADGSYLPPEALAAAGGSIAHELMTCLGPRIRRLFVYDESLRPR